MMSRYPVVARMLGVLAFLTFFIGGAPIARASTVAPPTFFHGYSGKTQNPLANTRSFPQSRLNQTAGGWSNADIGPVAAGSGSSVIDSSTGADAFGAGTMGGATDGLHYTYQSDVSGSSLAGMPTSFADNVPAKMQGLMYRASTDPGAPYFCACVYTVLAGQVGSQYTEYQEYIMWRTDQGTNALSVGCEQWPDSIHVWVRIDWVGNTFYAFWGSPTGWHLCTSITIPNLATGASVGFATDSGSNTQLHEVSWLVQYSQTVTTPGESLGGGSPSRKKTSCQATRHPVDCATGSFWHTFYDLSLTGRGPSLHFTHTYNSLSAAQDSPLGFGWTDSYNMYLTTDSGGNITVHEEGGSTVTFSLQGNNYVPPPRILASLTLLSSTGQFQFVRANQDRFFFSSPSQTSPGQLLQETSRNGYATNLSYTGALLTSVTDFAGRSLSLSYNASNRLAAATDSAGRSVSFGYDSSGNLTDVTDVGGGHWHFTYDANHLLLTMQDPKQYPNGSSLTNTYDTSARVIQQKDEMGRLTQFAYGTDANGYQTTTITDPTGNVTVQCYSSYVLMSLTRGFGTPHAATWNYSYDPYTLGVSSLTDPNGHTWSALYDSNGNLTSATDPLGNQTTYTYDNLNDLTSVTDPNTNKTTMTYDGNGNLASISRPLTSTNQTATTTFTHGDSSHRDDITAITDPNGTGHTTNFTYDPSTGYLLSATDALGNKRTFTYDALGRVNSLVSPNGNVAGGNPSAYTTSIGYDALGDITSISDPLQHQTIYTYDPNRNLSSTKDPRLNTTVYNYDADNELSGVGYPDGTATGFSYDASGNVLSEADGLNQPTAYTYDALNRVVSMKDPLSRVTNYGYDPSGNLTSLTDALARTSTYGYDAGNRLTSVTYSDGVTPKVSLGYDSDGNRTSMTDGTGTSTYTYDSLNRLTQSKNAAAQTVGYGYDLANNLTSIAYPGGSQVTRTYDLANRLTQVSDWSNRSTTFGYDANNNLTLQTYPNSTTASFTYNASDQLTQIVDKKSGSPFWTFGYTRDANGQLLSAVDPLDGLTHTYAYDALNRLLSDIRSAGTNSWSYNAADEITSFSDTGANTTNTLAYDPAHELTGFLKKTGSTTNQNLSLSYNANGSRTQQTDSVAGAATSYAYDQANRLTSFTKSGATSTYKYDGNGLRSSKTVGGKLNTFTWDLALGMPLLLQDSSNSYVDGPGGAPLEQITGTKAYFFYQDQLGSTRGLLDTKGSTVGTYTYGPYGDLKTSTGSVATALQFAGQYSDSESGLLYLRGRYYDPATLQFVSFDPAAKLTMQPYSYALDDPLNTSDPSGDGTGSVCVGASGYLWVGGFVQSCQVLGLGHSFPYVSWGSSLTVGGGFGTPSGGVNIGIQVTNANCINALSGLFNYAGQSFGQGPSGGYQYIWGKDAYGHRVIGAGPEAGIASNGPYGAASSAGVSYTSVVAPLGGSNGCACG